MATTLPQRRDGFSVGAPGTRRRWAWLTRAGLRVDCVFQLLMLCSLMSKPISAKIAVAAAKELFALGLRTPRKVLDADRSDMVRAFGRAHYVRYDESTATRLPEMARLAMAKYHGDLRRLPAGSNQETAGVTRLLKEFRGIGDTGAVNAFFAEAKHPTLGRPYRLCGYQPMIELLRYLEANGFATYIVSGGGRDFMRPITGSMYQIPPERVIGSSVGLIFRDGNLFTTAQPEFLDDGPIKPVRIWGRTGRRPIVAAGNSNGDIEMLEYAGTPDAPSLRLLVLHDDAEREFHYTAGAEQALDLAAKEGWTVASIKDDWATVFRDR
jgi:phosphoserine phosphatase